MKLKSIIKDIQFQNEYVLVNKNDNIFEVSKALAYGTKEKPKKKDKKQFSILAAYVLDGKKPVGLVTKEDIIEIIVKKENIISDLKKIKISEIMTYPFFSLDVNDEIQDAVNLIMEKNFLTIPVLENGELRGVFTVFDALWLLETEEANL
ncbi:MAG: CBS domain-containing protein [Candidatus Lokiarchaeota archaeon]|nr:CBS domain-containing protein [Candidatus Lokiarchaeota archaeon]